MNNFEKSESIDKIAGALCKFQGAMSGVAKNAKGFNYDYTNLEAILSSIQEPMKENGLSVSQFPINSEDGGLGIVTLVMHTSGQYLQSYFTSRIVDKPDIGKNCQAHGSLITYYRRYALQSALNLACIDDDGAEAKKTFTSSKTAISRPIKRDDIREAKKILFGEISKKQLDEVRACRIMKIKSYDQLKSENRIQEIKGFEVLIKAS
jgi:hypothetical protein